MARISFEDLKFREDAERPGEIRVDFMTSYYFYVDEEEFESIADYELQRDGSVEFSCKQRRAENKMNRLLLQGFEELYHRNRHKPATYIHKHSGIPLMGTNEFGIVDRGSNILEVKPLTGCNMSCIFCSVEEGVNDKTDIVVECDYLLEEFRKVAKIKEHPVEANIGPQGEPLLYPKLVELVRGLNDTPNVEVVSMNSNGVTLTPWLIDQLENAGLDRINLSIHAAEKEKARELMNGPYDLDEIKKRIGWCEGKIDVLLAPVRIQGYNEDQMDGLIELSKTINNEEFATIGIQNYLNYKNGRNIADELPWEDFFEFLQEKEEKHGVDLRMTKSTFKIKEDKTLDKPFRKGQRIDVELMKQGRTPHTMIGRAKGRCVTVVNPTKKNGVESVKLIRDKHNIFTGVTS